MSQKKQLSGKNIIPLFLEQNWLLNKMQNNPFPPERLQDEACVGGTAESFALFVIVHQLKAGADVYLDPVRDADVKDSTRKEVGHLIVVVARIPTDLDSHLDFHRPRVNHGGIRR